MALRSESNDTLRRKGQFYIGKGGKMIHERIRLGSDSCVGDGCFMDAMKIKEVSLSYN